MDQFYSENKRLRGMLSDADRSNINGNGELREKITRLETEKKVLQQENSRLERLYATLKEDYVWLQGKVMRCKQCTRKEHHLCRIRLAEIKWKW